MMVDTRRMGYESTTDGDPWGGCGPGCLATLVLLAIVFSGLAVAVWIGPPTTQTAAQPATDSPDCECECHGTLIR